MSLMRSYGKENAPSFSRFYNANCSNQCRKIYPRRSPSTSDTASTASTCETAGAGQTEEEVIAGVQNIAYREREKLLSIGGRSREINPDPGPCPDSKPDEDKRYHVSDDWHEEAERTERELEQGLDFRWHQFEMRKDSKIFNKYKEAIDNHREKKGINFGVELQLDRQTKLDEWREYYLYEHRKRLPLERKLEKANRELETRKERMKKAEQNGSMGVPWSILSERGEEFRRYDEKISHAQKQVDRVRKRLEILRVGDLVPTDERDSKMKRVEEDLESAQKSLEAEQSDDLDQLKKEYERRTAQEAVEASERKVDYANLCLARVDTRLQEIAGQFAEIATEYASSGWESQHNRDLLDGWEKYYVYMRERLQATQDHVAELVQEQVDCRMRKRGYDDAPFIQLEKDQAKEKEEEFKALWSWGRREFPEIAAKHSLSIHDTQSNGDHQAGDQASQPKGGKSIQRKGRPSRKQSPLSQVQPSKVFKPIQKRRKSVNAKLNATRHAVGPPEDHPNHVEQIKEQESPKNAVRRSKRIAQQASDPAPGPLRRSARIARRTEKLRSLGSNQAAKPAQSSTTAKGKRGAYSGTPKGISKTRRNAASKKKKKG